MIDLLLATVPALLAISIFILIAGVLLKRRPACTAQPATAPPTLSVIIPFRNEAANLGFLLDDLAAQTTSSSFETILVNDRSIDAFEPVISEFKKRAPNFRFTVIPSGFTNEIHLTGKQQALQTGCTHASGDWFLFTDADVRVSPTWVESYLSSMPSSRGVLFSRTEIALTKSSSLLDRYQAWQLDFLFAVAYGFSVAGFKGSCMGNNMAIAKKAWECIGGMKGLGYSIVEDRDLAMTAGRKGFSATPLAPFHCTIKTAPCRTYTDLQRQSARWIKGGMRGPDGLVLPILLMGVYQCELLLTFAGIIDGIPAFLVILDLLLFWLFIGVTFKRNGSAVPILEFPLFFAAQAFVTLALAIPALKPGAVRWKGDPV